MSFKFSSKAQTLRALSKKLTTARILPMLIVRNASWLRSREDVLRQVHSKFGHEPLIVRSSSVQEDQTFASQAGTFLTKLMVSTSDVHKAIDEVFQSYKTVTASDEVLIQPMLRSVVRSGVILTHDPNTCAPYRMINWHDGPDTTAVTSGRVGELWVQATSDHDPNNPWITQVLKMLEELIAATECELLDCEFAISDNSSEPVIWLLQVRPLILGQKPEPNDAHRSRLSEISEFLSNAMKPQPFLFGRKTIFGVMPDWNPAEIIGVRPRPLALSLYRELVTDSIWAYQRHNYGYKNLRSFPLMTHFWGQPYVDVRVSFNSFIPADIDSSLGEKLVNHYLQCLEANPHLHDKVEFEIVLSCYSFRIEHQLKELQNHGFETDECANLRRSLLQLTNSVINIQHGRWREDETRIAQLEQRRKKLMESDATKPSQIYWLIEDGKRYGTLPFAGLARGAFIAVQILRSLVSEDILSEKDLSLFMSNLETVSSSLVSDKEILRREEFLLKYGHLRPGTYDIRSPRFDEDPDLYFDWSDKITETSDQKSFSLNVTQSRQVGRLLKEHGIESSPADLLYFCKRVIELRESCKFEFTKNVSEVLRLLELHGREFGFSRDDMSFCDIQMVFKSYGSVSDHEKILTESISAGRRQFEHSCRLNLPSLICSPEDVWGFRVTAAEPNFVTQKVVVAPVVKVADVKYLQGAIVVIPNADPGYDWLFSHGVAGLVTQWGGTNSHMAIRAGELGIPAIIGAGELLYQRWSQASRIRIDCAARIVEVIN